MTENFANPHAVAVQPLDYSQFEGTNHTQTYHGSTIKVNNQVVGRIKSFHADGAFTRTITPVYELNKATWGRPVENIPGKNEQYTLTIHRAEVWDTEFERIIFGHVFHDLGDQTFPFTIEEFLWKGNEIYYIVTYSGCWFGSKTINAFTAEEDGIVIVEAQIHYVSRKYTGGSIIGSVAPYGANN